MGEEQGQGWAPVAGVSGPPRTHARKLVLPGHAGRLSVERPPTPVPWPRVGKRERSKVSPSARGLFGVKWREVTAPPHPGPQLAFIHPFALGLLLPPFPSILPTLTPGSPLFGTVLRLLASRADRPAPPPPPRPRKASVPRPTSGPELSAGVQRSQPVCYSEDGH